MQTLWLRKAGLATGLVLALSHLAACATLGGAPASNKQAQEKPSKFQTPKNYSIYRGKDIDWKILRRGQKERGTASFDSY